MAFQIRRFKAKSTKILTEDEYEDSSEHSFSSPRDISFTQKTPFQTDQSDSNSKLTNEKKKYKGLRLSFGHEESDQEHEIFVPKKSLLSQQSQKEKPQIGSQLQINIPKSVEKMSSETPKYNSEYLSELRSSTPSTPKEFCTIYKETINMDDLSITENISYSKAPKILDEGIVKALKERRTEKIKQKDDNQMVLFSKTNESRLQREDDLLDDGIEGFREYVDDGIVLNKDLEKRQAKQKRIEMEDAIEEAENIDIEEEFSSEEESRIWEQTQIRKGVYGPNFVNTNLTSQKKYQPIITQIPKFENSINRLKNKLFSMKSDRDIMLSEIETLMLEKEEISKRENDVKESLEKASRDYSNLQIKTPQVDSPIRGLDSIASYTVKRTPISQSIS
ncbi:unnamed protein product [Pneumocystis jirovecii]|uniref:Uncharacterized protein n=1 Tax=Pneumocystis jirovecii TaxID=42068 RepID=L0PD79_PNEJI|nr:unnamed protein product [Pneumocystis jirovecii]